MAKAAQGRVKAPFAKEQDLLAAWRQSHERFVEDAILEPYNRTTARKVSMTTQQRDASRLLSMLMNAKLARATGKATEADLLTAKKIGLSVMAGKGLGKDAWLSWVVLWFVSLFPDCKVPCVSVSADQLHKVLWSEIAKWMRHSAVAPWLVLQNDKLYFKDLPEQIAGKQWFAFPKTANPKASEHEQTEGIAGIHEDYVLAAVDEASGVSEGVFEALESTLTGMVNLMILIFNPTRSTGYAINSQTTHADDWLTMRWNAEESELGNADEIARLERRYGTDSNPYRIRVLGLPPRTDEHTLIPWEWIEEAVERELEGYEALPLVKGVDCGAGGDQSIIASRRGPQVYALKRLTTPDSTVLTNWVGMDIDAEHPDTVFVDTIGIGWAVEGALRQKKGAVVEAADFRRTADNIDKYVNKRAESYDRLRDAFETGAISIPDDQELKNQLGALQCEYVGSKMKIVEKKKLKAAIGHSPDEADALAMTWYRESASRSKVTAMPGMRRRYEAGEQGWLAA